MEVVGNANIFSEILLHLKRNHSHFKLHTNEHKKCAENENVKHYKSIETLNFNGFVFLILSSFYTKILNIDTSEHYCDSQKF